ncbi:thiamine pyrophosphate-binding protein [Actinomadura sp. NBRC 104412]|uniref:thiamine pyrophosphate-binding protein n=1 Tax=Actinomadura sp. NBRC 104412 TaxID=3032203 RepID=UPI0024A594F1|nr:thiamine pyrophosphate-binding protein [Actinomadura sp. NBRC 104412]GLZ07805.1 thiamine pyrophosphate-binding protein [Actinomadura sp. NBRC 104412]
MSVTETGTDRTPVEVPVGPAADRTAGYVSDHLVDLLRSLGCTYLPLNPGSSFRGLHDSLVNHGGNRDPQLLLCLHEEIAVSLAHGYAKATGGVAVAAVHDLVGLMHASMAVYDAWCDRAPLLLLGGGGPLTTTARRPIDWLHSAANQAQLVRDYVKWDDEPADPQALLDGVARGHQLAGTAPTGPVYVTVDADLQEQPAPPEGLHLPDLRRCLPQPGPGADPDQVLAAARLLVAAEAPLIVAGRVGLRAEATAPLVELAELLAAAYQDAPNTVCFPTAHPHNLSGDPAVLDTADAVLAVDLADLRAVRPVGSSREPGAAGTASTDRDLVAITLDPLAPSGWSHAGQAPVPIDVPLLAEPLTGLRQLRDAVADLVSAEPPDRRRVRERRRENVAARHRELRARQRAAVEGVRGQAPIAPAYLAAAVWDAVRDRPWLLTLRNTRSWPEGIWQFPGGGSFLGHSGGGGVGYGPGAMVGGALAARDSGRLPVAIIGDGDLLMAPGALWTAVHYRIPLLIVVNNNRSFHNDEEHQYAVARHRGRPVDNSWIGMRIDGPAVDLAAMARSYGAWAAGPVTDPAALPAALGDALQAVDEGQVALVDVHTAPRPRTRR